MRAASARSGLQDSAVRQERLERGGIAAVALFAADVTAAVGRTIPIREMVRSGGLGSGEMAISTPALLRHCRCREQEQPRKAKARSTTESLRHSSSFRVLVSWATTALPQPTAE